MKKLLIMAAVAVLLTMGACKPNETQYKAAYEAAVAKRDSKGDPVENTIYNRYRQQARQTYIPLNGDTLAVQTEFIGYTKDGGATREGTQRYNVVVGSFKQVFNARAMRERLAGLGYENPFILHTREPLYYVVAATCSTAQEALDELKRVKADTSLVLRAPLPFVLQPAHMAR